LRVQAGLIQQAVVLVVPVILGRVALVDRQISGQVARVVPAVLIRPVHLRAPAGLILRT
jgi:hypothetical protein